MSARLVVVDDHPVVRLGLVQLIQLDPELVVVAESGSAEQALPMLDGGGVDLVVTDLRMEGLDGLAFTRLIKASHPELAVLMLSSFDESLFAEQALDAGASGYVMKNATPEHLHGAVRAALSGRVTLSPPIWARLLPVRPQIPADLAPDEVAVLNGLAGAPTTELGMARRVGLPVRRVEQVRHELMLRMNLRSPMELLLAVQWARHHAASS